MAEETVVLHLEVDQGAAERQLERIEGVLIDNKKAVQDLQAAYKKGNVTQAEYVKENIRLQQNIKKEQDLKKTLIKTIETESNSRNALKNRISTLVKEYDNLNLATDKGIKRADALEKELAQLNAQLTKGDKSAGLFKNQIGNYPKVLGDAASQVKVAGVSLGDLGTKLTALANPVTAGIALIGALGAAYAASTTGARDLQKAQDLVSNSFTLGIEAFGDYIGTTEDGEGILTRITETLLFRYAPAIAAASQAMSIAEERLRDLEISRAFAAGDAKESERRAEIERRIRDDEQKALDERIASSLKIDALLEASGQRTKIIIQAQIAAIKESTVNYDLNRAAQLKVAQLTAEIADKQEEITGKLTENVKARQAIIDKQKESLDLQRKELELFGQDIREANAPPIDLGAFGSAPGESLSFSQGIDDDLVKATDQANKEFIKNAELKVSVVKRTEGEIRGEYLNTLEEKKRADQAQVQSAKIIFSALSQIAQDGSAEQRALTLVSIALDTGQAIAGATAAASDIPYPGNLVAIATSIATVLSNIAAAYNAIKGFEEGGYTGDGGKHDVAGVVHKGEYVVPQSVNYAPAAQPYIHVLESMRTRGYADGGFVANQSTAPVNQSLIIANALKQIPRPIVDVREVTSAQRRVEVRESQATLS